MNNSFDFELLRRLCCADGVSGYEDEVRDIIISEIYDFCDDVCVDACGNVLAFKKGKKTPPKRLMLCAHMDEVGFAVKHINEDGTLLVDEVGMNTVIMPSKRVKIGAGKIRGVIGASPVHLSKGQSTLTINDIFIDIGAKNRDEAMGMGVFGEYASFESQYTLFGNGLVKAKALDDRIGCAIMCCIAKNQLEYDTFFAFTVGEELGGVGASAAAERLSPDICLVLEGTTASDLPECKGPDKVCCLRSGPVSPYMDAGTMYDYKLYTGIRNLAQRNNIPTQTKNKVSGGTDARNIQPASGGIRVAALSLPCRYIHTPSSVAALCDAENMYKLSLLLTKEIYNM